MKKKTKTLLLRIALALAVIFIAGASYTGCRMYRTIRRVVMWENLHNTLYDCRKKFTNIQPPLSSDPHHPTDVSDLLEDNDYIGGRRDLWGTEVKIYFIKAINNKFYGKAISAGPDRIFGTPDDVIDSEFDNTNTIYSNINSWEEDLKDWNNQKSSTLR
jgi:hypothetical protein